MLCKKKLLPSRFLFSQLCLAGFTQRATLDPDLNEIHVLSVSCFVLDQQLHVSAIYQWEVETQFLIMVNLSLQRDSNMLTTCLNKCIYFGVFSVLKLSVFIKFAEAAPCILSFDAAAAL